MPLGQRRVRGNRSEVCLEHGERGGSDEAAAHARSVSKCGPPGIHRGVATSGPLAAPQGGSDQERDDQGRRDTDCRVSRPEVDE